ncbi:MAG TPA: hypothetical protein VLZ89_10490 [Anaerolineales bacterium]|nr:hypothetical protein [Anaerolineales bacterium]
MPKSNAKSKAEIPAGLRPHFQEYDLAALNIARDANLIMQRTLEYGTWDEIRWLFQVYDVKEIRAFLRRYGQRWLRPAAFNYWRKLLGIRRWRQSGLTTPKGELWEH